VEGSSLSQLLCLAGMLCWRRRHALKQFDLQPSQLRFLRDLLMPICVALQGYLYAMQACADKKLLHQPGSKFSSTNLCNADFVTMKAGSHNIFLSFLRGD